MYRNIRIHTTYLYVSNVFLTQNKGKESEEIMVDRHTNTHMETQNQNISTDTAVFLNQNRANVCEHTIKMASLEYYPFNIERTKITTITCGPPHFSQY